MKSLLPLIAQKASPTVSQFIGRRQLVLKKNAPHIAFGLGIAGTVASTVLACRATIKLPPMLEQIEIDVSVAKQVHRDNEDRGRELAKVYTQGALKLGRLYGPSVAVGLVSVGTLTGAHVNLTRRNTSLMAAYAALSAAYDNYRNRVIEELGVDRELDIRRGSDPVVDEGRKVFGVSGYSQYAQLFDEKSTQFEKDPEFNRIFITCQQNYANDLLRAKGHLFLNEVYDMLGLDRSSAGAVVGWVIGRDGDNFVDFGMYEATSENFLNGQEPRVWLDFNVDGVIYDLI